MSFHCAAADWEGMATLADLDKRVRSLELFSAWAKGAGALLLLILSLGAWKWPSAGEPGKKGEDAVGAPVGSIVAWHAKSKPPGGWRICDGASVDAISKEFDLTPAERGVLMSSVHIVDGGIPKLADQFLRGAATNDEVGVAKLGPPPLVRDGDRFGYSVKAADENRLAGAFSPAPSADTVVLDPRNVAVHWIIRVK